MGAVTSGFQYNHFFIRHHLGQLTKRRIEALDMPHLQQTIHPACRLAERSRFILTSRNWLFDQNVQPSL